MTPRTKEFVFTISQKMHSDPAQIIDFIKSAMIESELSLFDALSAAIGCYGETELAQKNGISQPMVSKTKGQLKSDEVEDAKKMRIALKVLAWFDLSLDHSKVMTAICIAPPSDDFGAAK